MNAAVVYFSRTGNTRCLAQKIADTLKVSLYDLSSIQPTEIESFDILILGTPVEGASPAKETITFIEGIKKQQGAKAILFTTYRIFGNMRAMKAMEKALFAKGYTTILKVSKKGMKPGDVTDVSDVLEEIKKALV
jgi:flavodoxin